MSCVLVHDGIIAGPACSKSPADKPVWAHRSDPDVAKALGNGTGNSAAVQPTVAKSANNADVPIELVQDLLESVRPCRCAASLA